VRKRRGAAGGDRDPQERPAVEIPHDVTNEQVLLAAALVDEGARAALVPKLSPDLFVEPSHAAVWQAMRQMRQRRVGFSMSTLHQACAGRAEMEYLESLRLQYPEPPASLEHHASILRWDAVRADAVQGPVADLLRALRDPLAPRERVRALARQVAQVFDQATDRQFMRDPVVLAREHAEEMRQRSVWPYGIDGLDVDEEGRHRLVPGAAPKKVTILTGVSGAAKSVLAELKT